MGTEAVNKVNMSDWLSLLAYDQWIAFPVSTPKPLARYKHGAAVVDEKLYISGGSRNGRYLSDLQVFDFRNLEWSIPKINTESNADRLEDSLSLEPLPPIAGHNMVRWGNKLLLVGGLSKKSSDIVTVRFIDLETHGSGVLKSSGNIPVSREGQSVTLVGSKLLMFGGEDINRKLHNDIHILDLEEMTWNLVETRQTPPAPRYDHTAALHAEHYFLIFGGCSHSTCFNDLHVLDLQTMEWSQPQIQGDIVNPRAGHASITIGENWYIVGGGDNRSGAPETLVLNMPKLVWSVLTTVKERDPLSSEGLSVCSALVDGENLLVAFGGYNGTYNNEVFVMRPKLRESSRPKIFQSPAAAAAAASVTAAYALAKSEHTTDFIKMEGPNTERADDSSQQKFALDINLIRKENKAMETEVAEARAENSRLTEKIEETISTHTDLTKELHSVQGQLAAERSRCSKLEAQIAELQRAVESLPSLEEEVEKLRTLTSSLKEDMEIVANVQRQSSGGVWRWIAGGTPSS